MQAIARAAGVDPSTVSRVLSGQAAKARIGKQTARKVLAAAARLGYRPNLAARALRTNRTHTLGLLVTELANPFFATIAAAVEDQARQKGYATIIATSGEDPSRETEYLSLLRSRPVDGVIVTPTPGARARKALQALASGGFPMVCIDRRVPGLRCDRVVVDNRGGAAQLVTSLAAIGARRLAIAGGPAAVWTAAERLAGFRAGLKRARLPFSKTMVRSGSYSTETGAKAARAFMRAKRPPDAIFAANNRILLGVVQALQQTGPKAAAVSLAAFDGLPFAGLLSRQVLIAEQPREEIGRRAVDLLVQRIDEIPTGGPREVVLPVQVRRFGPESGPFELGV
jgi:LacI family transcriptional regulator